MSSSAATSSAGQNVTEGGGRAECIMSEETASCAAKSKHRSAEIRTHSDTEWKPDHDSEEYASSGSESYCGKYLMS